ncbi:peptidoglycan DD-metalloendopeptidase family protein [Allosaccharopolyspora coralli]|uniref:Peptidoglycan DD-metalloendopeptidase family protein n=1 Tax=Allosaccharopolyspora coralli TaxID=2665642 RepID=A0A5Q3Q6N0_9PSEU|nr:M23 family metallopeptidase [Allosaccharopolyspora coralli]QGK70311.1 peptidoglycan DD-metalloendopeptidase family protein [Allosaccharopolyspora coralli]
MIKAVRLALAATAALIILATTVLSGAVAALVTTPAHDSTEPSEHAVADIPANYLALYRAAAPHCPGLDWSILAAIGKVETNHGRLDAPGVLAGENASGAGGPMQFLEPTFEEVVSQHEIPPGGAVPPSRYVPHDAIYAATFYLCDNGARDNRDLYGAIFTYNHADWYVRKVLTQAGHYRAAATTPTGSGGWVVPAHGTCTSGFGPRDGAMHNGLDIAAPTGTPIHAAADGTVIDSGPASGYGLWIRLRHPNGVITTYGHNNTNHVATGQAVRAGQPIGEVGNRGQSTGPHLHFQIDLHRQPVDPLDFYAQQRGPDLCGP